MSQDIENKLDFKDKLFLFYKRNKFIITSLIIIILLIFHDNFNKWKSKEKNILQAENYKGWNLSFKWKRKQAVEIFEEIIKSKNKFYSILAINTILEKI